MKEGKEGKEGGSEENSEGMQGERINGRNEAQQAMSPIRLTRDGAPGKKSLSSSGKRPADWRL
ncbi:MAG: hypothetical protein LBW85_13935 [Deltaproteobacteria bacterium]|jgi:hypothetical protein|nr:hypothetical protein [Deltaproteobacteria bacterium]